MDTIYQKSISLDCPHCRAKCQFEILHVALIVCVVSERIHAAYSCTHCHGIIVTKWAKKIGEENFEGGSFGNYYLTAYYPQVGAWKPKMDLSLIVNDGAKEDFQEAISCYDNGFYNACMVMTRRAIYQEMTKREPVAIFI